MRIKTTCCLLTILCAASAPSLPQPAGAQDDETRHELQIAAGPLGRALNQLATQSRVQILYEPRLVEGRTVPSLVGESTLQEALGVLLQGADITPHRVNGNSVVLRRTEASRAEADATEDEPSGALTGRVTQAGEPVAGVTVTATSESLEGSRVVTTGENGDYKVLTLPPGAYSVRFELEGLVPVVEEVRVPPGEASTLEIQMSLHEVRGETVTVTGTNIRGAAPASPLIVIDREAIDLSGVVTVGELLEQLPQNFGGGFNEDGGAITGFNAAHFSGASTVNLRGLGPAASLVLFNGRRLASASSDSLVDVSMLPVSAIERVEVLTDGASAVYGSDAIAGVVNFIMRRDYDGAETRLRVGTVTEGDLREYRAVQALGKNWDNSNIFFNYQYYNRGDLEALDRDFTVDLAPDTLPNRDEIDVLPRQESHNVLVSGTHAVSDRLSLQGDFLFTSRENNREGEFLDAPQAIAGKTDQYAATLATFFELSESWEFELAGVFGKNKFVSQSFTLPDNVSTGGLSSGENELWSIDSRVSGALINVPAGKVDVAFGGQYREESLEAPSARGARQLWSLFAETLIPIAGANNEVRGIRKLDLSLAVRHEDYSDFGPTTDPKLGLIWLPTESLAFRGTWGTSFRAPSLDQLDVGPVDQTAFFFDFADPSMPDGFTTALLEFSIANDQLGPETSTASTIGFDYQPEVLDGLDLSVTYFNIKYEDRISVPTNSLLTAFVNRDAFASLILDNPTVTQSTALVNRIVEEGFFQNATGRPFDPAEVEAIFDNRIQNLSSTDVRGLDFSASHRFTADVGDIGLSLTGSYMFDFINKATPRSSEDNAINRFLRPVDLRFRPGATWSKDGLTAAAFANYTDSYRNDVFSPPTEIGSWTTVDLHVSYDTGDRLGNYFDNAVVSFNVRNLFDQNPPSVGDGPALLGSGLSRPVDYDPANASPLGRFVSVELKKTF